MTPLWTITSINENSDWTTVNDPCALELGTGWRIPTYTEWTNVAASGGWTSWDDPWGSNLKIHAAGALYLFDGWLFNQGSNAYYWSSTQWDDTNGWYLYFYSLYCYMNYDDKANGFSLRCLRE